MTYSPTRIEREKEMQFPVLPKGKCVNHPKRQSIQRHLCIECLEKWQRDVLSFNAIQEGTYDE